MIRAAFEGYHSLCAVCDFLAEINIEDRSYTAYYTQGCMKVCELVNVCRVCRLTRSLVNAYRVSLAANQPTQTPHNALHKLREYSLASKLPHHALNWRKPTYAIQF